MKSFRTGIKETLSLTNITKTPKDIIKEINAKVLDWCYYFTPGPNQAFFSKTLDFYIFKRTKMWLYKKYGAKGYASAIIHYMVNHSFNENEENNYTLRSSRLKKELVWLT
jgi:hypothetical protein